MTTRSVVPRPARRILFLTGLSTSVLAAGTLGLYWIEGKSLFDSFYMALITLTTVGYEETITLSRAGRIFNSILILTGCFVVFIALGMLGDLLIQMELRNYFEQRKTKRMIQRLSDHYIVCGLGRVGRGVIRQRLRSDASVVAIDRSEAHAEWARDQRIPLLVGDATLDSTLEQAGTQRASGLVAAISSDPENVYVTLSARVLNPNLRIVARATDENARNKLLQAGAQTIFTPYAFIGYRLAQALLRPKVSRFLDVSPTFEGTELDLDIDQVEVTKSSRCAARTIDESQLNQRPDLIVLAVNKAEGAVLFNPRATTRMEAGDVLIVMGKRPTLERLHDELEY